MKVLFESAFLKDIKSLCDKDLSARVLNVIEECKTAENLSKLSSVVRLSGYSNYYRIRVGNYRIGLKYMENTITFIRLLHRKDIYKYFPKK